MSWQQRLQRLLPPGARRADPLGEGVWRRAHDRFGRSVERFAAIEAAVAGLDAPAPTTGLLASLRADLEGARDDVRALCVTAQTAAPSTGLDVPGGDGGRWLDVHRDLSRAATACAQACEAATMLRVEVEQGREGGRDAVRRAVEAARAAVGRAQVRASA